MLNSPDRLVFYCFCAAWCSACGAYADVFNLLSKQYAHGVDFVWVDIEDHADVMADVDIENFPSVLISDAQHIYFYGVLLPHLATAQQLMSRVVDGNMQPITGQTLQPTHPTAIVQLNSRLRSTSGNFGW